MGFENSNRLPNRSRAFQGAEGPALGKRFRGSKRHFGLLRTRNPGCQIRPRRIRLAIDHFPPLCLRECSPCRVSGSDIVACGSPLWRSRVLFRCRTASGPRNDAATLGLVLQSVAAHRLRPYRVAAARRRHRRCPPPAIPARSPRRRPPRTIDCGPTWVADAGSTRQPAQRTLRNVARGTRRKAPLAKPNSFLRANLRFLKPPLDSRTRRGRISREFQPTFASHACGSEPVATGRVSRCANAAESRRVGGQVVVTPSPEPRSTQRVRPASRKTGHKRGVRWP